MAYQFFKFHNKEIYKNQDTQLPILGEASSGILPFSFILSYLTKRG